jgi:hypothetical protein
MHLWFRWYCWVGLVFLIGCSNKPRMYKVAGDVTFDGQPLPEGTILLLPQEKTIAPEEGKITNGHFEFKAREGKMRVAISAARIIPGSKIRGAGGEPVPEEYIPDRYNSKSKLEAEVAARDDNNFKFDLESKRK